MTSSAQIHVPNLAPPLPFRVRSAVIVARRRFGVTLIVGTLLLAATSAVAPNANAVALMAATWSGAILIAVVTASRAGTWSSHVGPSARLSWGLFFAGLALASPLTLHAILQPWEWAPNIYAHFGERSFAGWVRSSVYLTGVSHVVFAVLCFVRGFRGDGKPHLALIGVVTTLVTLVDVVLWAGYAILPTAYVGATVIPLLFAMRRLERLHD